MNEEFQIDNIFPTPVYSSSVKVHKELIDEIDKYEYGLVLGDFNRISYSIEQQVLNQKVFEKQKNEIDAHMHKFYYDVLGYNRNSYLEMVNSWVVKSPPGTESAPHHHKNSLFSGVWYLKVPENSGTISFISDRSITQLFAIPVSIHNEYNTRNTTFVVSESAILLFPSSLEHKVDPNNSNEVRISIAFNYFVKGKICDVPTGVLDL